MSGKAEFVPGNHGPAIIEGPATALSWLTILPAFGTATTFDRTTGKRAMNSLPFVGLIIGALTFILVAALTHIYVNEFLIATTCVIFWQLITRMLHLDGLADVGDALGSHKDPQEAQKILADRYTGALGMGSVLLTVLAQISGIIAILTVIRPISAAFIIASIPLITRTAALLPCHTRFKPMSEHGFGAMVIGTVRGPVIAVWIAIVGVFLYLGALLALLGDYPPGTPIPYIAPGPIDPIDLPNPPAEFKIPFEFPWLFAEIPYQFCVVIALATTLIVAFLLARYYARRFAGLNGDCIGAIIEITTACTAAAYPLAYHVLVFFIEPGLPY